MLKNKFQYYTSIFFIFINWAPDLSSSSKYEVGTSISVAYSLLCKEPGFINAVLFTPFDEVKSVLLGLINAEQRTILVAAYRLTDNDLAEALIRASKRGVRVNIILDHGAVDSAYQKISKLSKAGIAMRVYYRGLYSIMHHKFFIFERNFRGTSIVCHGSANPTGGGMIRNQECVHIINHPTIVKRFKELFNKLAQSSALTPYKEKNTKRWL